MRLVGRCKVFVIYPVQVDNSGTFPDIRFLTVGMVSEYMYNNSASPKKREDDGMSDSVAFFLVPKKEVAYLPINCTMRQAMERMEHHGYTAVPIIDEDNKYIGTLTEGDLLSKFKNTPDLDLRGTEKIMLNEIPRRMDNQPVRIYASIQDLLSLVADQNFVPVVDDNDVFIGIVRRREILEHYTKQIQSKAKDKKKSVHPSSILAEAGI